MYCTGELYIRSVVKRTNAIWARVLHGKLFKSLNLCW